jgi:ribosomal-protein-alanine N-acetyltransferase
MSGEIFLRDYRDLDLESMFQLDEACFAEAFRFDRESMREFATAEGAITLIVEDVSSGLAGFAITHVERRSTETYGYVVTLDVAPESRRTGVARLLMKECERRALLAGATWMGLHVFAKNEEAIRFYEGRGYRQTGMRAGFYGRALDALVYRKDLEQAG